MGVNNDYGSSPTAVLHSSMASLIEMVGHALIPDWDFDYACCREAVLFTNILYAVFLLADSALFLLYFYLFARNKTIHANFRVILLILAVNDMALIYHRLADFWLTGRIDRENGFTYFIKMNCWATLIFSLCNVIGERSFALYAYQWYHDAYWRFPTPIIVAYALQEIVVGPLIVKKMISKRLIMDCLAVVTLLTALFLVAVYRISRRRHRQMIATRFQWSDDNSTLHRRLRTMEILRENHLLQAFLPYLLISTLLQVLEGIFVMHILVPIDHRYYLIAHCVFYLTIAMRVFFGLLIPILAHPVIKADASKAVGWLIRRFNRKRRRVKVEMELSPSTTHTAETQNIHSTDGQRLSFSPEEEKEMYFAGYTELWGGPPATHRR